MNEKFEKIRRHFPHTDKIVFLNTAAFSPMTLPVKQAINANLDIRMAAEVDDTKQMYALRERVRAGYANLVGAETRQIGVNINTSFGLNLASSGLPLKEGDEVLMSDIEFPATIYCWRGASETRKLKLKFVKSQNLRFDIDELEKSITDKSRVLSISFVQFFNGFKNDLKRLSEICRRHNLFFVVDGIQGAGAETINVRELDIDIFSCGSQKWLLAPFGSGFFYISDRVKDILISNNITWYSSDWKLQFSDLFQYDLPYHNSAEKFQGGYYATMNLLGMEAALQIINELGVEKIQKHNHELIDKLVENLKDSEYFRITSSLKEKERSSIFTIACDNLKELHRFLFDNKIYTACREGSIRIAPHLFNNESDIDKISEVLKLFEKEHAPVPAGKLN